MLKTIKNYLLGYRVTVVMEGGYKTSFRVKDFTIKRSSPQIYPNATGLHSFQGIGYTRSFPFFCETKKVILIKTRRCFYPRRDPEV